jgi:hypothetical protein
MLATSPWPFLLRLQELSKYPTGATSRLMNTSNSSMKELESKVNGVVLTTTCITLLMERALSNHWVLNYQDMLEDYYDFIGNISTSTARRDDDKVSLQLDPRFPIFGQWNTDFNL